VPSTSGRAKPTLSTKGNYAACAQLSGENCWQAAILGAFLLSNGVVVMGVSSIVFWLLLLGVIGYIIAIYNRLVTLKNRYLNAFSQIEVQLKRRYDLIPNLVEVAKGYMAHERETLEAVIAARNNAAAVLDAIGKSGAGGAQMSQLSGAETALGQALGSLNVTMEAYPDLKASDNMTTLSEELSTTENRVAFSRQGFNDAATSYNIYRQSFPPVFFAVRFGHPADAQLLEFEDSAQIAQAPQVSF
jgi:LemA protein